MKLDEEMQAALAMSTVANAYPPTSYEARIFFAGYRLALERAAKVCDERTADIDPDSLSHYAAGCNDCAAAIRALGGEHE